MVIAPGVVSRPAPGHTAGHGVYHLEQGYLFTGDTLHWNQRRRELDVFPIRPFIPGKFWPTLWRGWPPCRWIGFSPAPVGGITPAKRSGGGS